MTTEQKTRQLTRTMVDAPLLTERIVQFGEGNFLRAFVDWMVQKMNERIGFDTGIVIVQPREKNKVAKLNAQDGLYTVRLTGLKDGEVTVKHDLITCVNRGVNAYLNFNTFLDIARNPHLQFMVSNTTEAGVAFVESDRLGDEPPSSFPGKLTRLLYERFTYFIGDAGKGLILMPTELIDQNGDALHAIVQQYIALWQLPDAFRNWVKEHCTFCNSLVDRIVPGFPQDNYTEIVEELGYDDQLLVEGEHFHLWVIQAPPHVREAFPAPDAGLNVIFTDDLEKHRKRKVRILNGAHTCMVPVAFLAGLETVRESINDEVIGKYLEQLVFDEILPALDPDDETLTAYARDTLDRFRNPYIRHYLISIALNSVSKFRTRVLPSLYDYFARTDTPPICVVLALAALIRFYQGTVRGQEIPLNDDPEIIRRMKAAWTAHAGDSGEMKQLSETILSDTFLWGRDLTDIDGLAEQVATYLKALDTEDPANAITKLISQISK